MRALISYEHLSPAQVGALRRACAHFQAANHSLLPVEFFGGLPLYGWTLADAQRPEGWPCLFPDRTAAPRWLVFTRLAALVRRERIDVVAFNGWFEPVSWGLALARRLLNVRLVLVADSTAIDAPRRWLVEQGKRRFLRRIDAAFTAGTRQVAYLEQLGLPRRRAAMGCDVVDNVRFTGLARSAAEASADARSPVVIATAVRLVAVKNLEAALEAFARVARSWPAGALRWRIAGQGPLAEVLKDRARALDAPVDFEGFVPYDRMPAFYAGAALYWQPSRSEPWGLAINEAAAAGLPILASDRCGAADDLVTRENGWLHDPSVDGMTRGLETALAARLAWPAMGARSRAVVASWDLDRFAAGLLEAVTLAARRPVAVGAAAPQVRTP